MDPENNNKTSSDANSTDESIRFSHVTGVASGWILDFMFVSLCRRFKEGKLDEFSETLSTIEAMTQDPSFKGNFFSEKINICSFLARIMHGKQLDTMFEEDESVTPLMSAANIWSKLEHAVADERLFKNVTILLLVQLVAICLEKGQRSSASSNLKWFENNHEFPQQSLRVKLLTIVKQGDTDHPLLASFSFSCLLETVESFLDSYLEKNPSDFLLKAATKVVRSSQTSESLEGAVSRDGSHSETEKKSTKSKKPKRKLLSTKISDVWKPDSCKKPFISLRRIPQNELSEMMSEKSPGTSMVQKSRKPRRKWNTALDQHLKAGVRRHGRGKWSRILLDYDFEGRTGVMLKDRWRILTRAGKA
ncbi:telomeric repeat-binding factor 1 isoform X1 [Brachyistius frenatus]|uniref:telomeric repeat-binding factor 1 isoform X1 n=1 Tax=Brachyistius frenatus TaxID=100188 RepID=UPI0037E7DB8B